MENTLSLAHHEQSTHKDEDVELCSYSWIFSSANTELFRFGFVDVREAIDVLKWNCGVVHFQRQDMFLKEAAADIVKHLRERIEARKRIAAWPKKECYTCLRSPIIAAQLSPDECEDWANEGAGRSVCNEVRSLAKVEEGCLNG